MEQAVKRLFKSLGAFPQDIRKGIIGAPIYSLEINADKTEDLIGYSAEDYVSWINALLAERFKQGSFNLFGNRAAIFSMENAAIGYLTRATSMVCFFSRKTEDVLKRDDVYEIGLGVASRVMSVSSPAICVPLMYMASYSNKVQPLSLQSGGTKSRAQALLTYAFLDAVVSGMFVQEMPEMFTREESKGGFSKTHALCEYGKSPWYKMVEDDHLAVWERFWTDFREIDK